METDRPLFLKFRNEKGEVQVCLTVSEDAAATMHAGFSCCNPKDIHLPRKTRTPKHHAASEGRMKKNPVSISLPFDFGQVPESEQRGLVRVAVIDFMREFRDHNLGLRPYTGDPERCEFHQWFGDFYEELVSSD